MKSFAVVSKVGILALALSCLAIGALTLSGCDSARPAVGDVRYVLDEAPVTEEDGEHLGMMVDCFLEEHADATLEDVEVGPAAYVGAAGDSTVGTVVYWPIYLEGRLEAFVYAMPGGDGTAYSLEFALASKVAPYLHDDSVIQLVDYGEGTACVDLTYGKVFVLRADTYAQLVEEEDLGQSEVRFALKIDGQ